MKTRKKLELDQLKVHSFVTHLEATRRCIFGGNYLTQFNCPDSWDCPDTGGGSQPLPCFA